MKEHDLFNLIDRTIKIHAVFILRLEGTIPISLSLSLALSRSESSDMRDHSGPVLPIQKACQALPKVNIHMDFFPRKTVNGMQSDTQFETYCTK